MARPREFDEQTVLDAVVGCFWRSGYQATSIRDLIEKTGVTGASLYNAFGDKRALYERALAHYVEDNISDRIRRCEGMAPRDAIGAFFSEVLNRSLEDTENKGCLLVNTAFNGTPQDRGFREAVDTVLVRIETFFLRSIKAGQADGTFVQSIRAEDYARHLLGVLMGMRVLARVRPDKALLTSVIEPALAQLTGSVPDQVWNH